MLFDGCIKNAMKIQIERVFPKRVMAYIIFK